MVLTKEYQSRVKNEKLTAKHVVEEAMTEAFVRKCNNCNKVFLKESGCNRIKCDCGNLQCYVCGVNVADYSHFVNSGNGKICPLYGELHLEKQVAEAQERTVRELLENRADLEDDDIRVDKAVVTCMNNMNHEALTPPQNIAMANGLYPWLRLPPVRNKNNPHHLCVPCQTFFRSARSLSQHQEAKNHRNPMCRRCDRSFASRHSLAQHKKDKHGI